jgi:DNA polymerase gamma 1
MAWDKEPILWDETAKGFYTSKHGLLPHPTDRGQPVANMFLKDFAALHESGFISVPEAVKPLAAKKTASINWVSTRKRVASIRTESPDGHPVAIPILSPNGTVTGRATDPIWQVLPNPKKSRIGTELKSMVAPFPGYSFVGADVASQEAWLAACHGDEDLGFCGSTPFGLTAIVGTKEDGTDIHSVLANSTGKSRDTTKTRVYGSLYGQGIKGDSDVLLKADPSLSEVEANSASKKFISLLKGKKEYGTQGYSHGMASAAFTQMERLADKRHPVTPLTGACMSGSLAGVKDYKPTRVNWIVQASGVDFRDMLVLLTISFYRRLGVRGRLIITIHDEIRTMVRNADIPKAVYALQLAHLYVRAAFIRAHGLNNIPAGVSWFPEVDVDNICLRKTPYDPQVTPTQTALPPGYTISPQQLLEALDGRIVDRLG